MKRFMLFLNIIISILILTPSWIVWIKGIFIPLHGIDLNLSERWFHMSPWHIFELFFNLQNIMIDLFSKFIDLDYLSFILFGVTFSWEREVFSL